MTVELITLANCCQTGPAAYQSSIGLAQTPVGADAIQGLHDRQRFIERVYRAFGQAGADALPTSIASYWKPSPS